MIFWETQKFVSEFPNVAQVLLCWDYVFVLLLKSVSENMICMELFDIQICFLVWHIVTFCGCSVCTLIIWLSFLCSVYLIYIFTNLSTLSITKRSVLNSRYNQEPVRFLCNSELLVYVKLYLQFNIVIALKKNSYPVCSDHFISNYGFCLKIHFV